MNEARSAITAAAPSSSLAVDAVFFDRTRCRRRRKDVDGSGGPAAAGLASSSVSYRPPPRGDRHRYDDECDDDEHENE